MPGNNYLMPGNNYFMPGNNYLMPGNNVIFWWDDDDGCILLDQQTESLHSDTLSRLQAYKFLLLLLDAAWSLTTKSWIWSDWELVIW
jgi:hypothetical protein